MNELNLTTDKIYEECQTEKEKSNIPNKNDDIGLLSEYFDEMMINCRKEFLVPIHLTGEFFVEYCKFF